MMGQQLSGTSGLAAIGYDWETEQKRLADEARKQQKLQARGQEEAEQAGFAQQIARGQSPGAPPPGGAPGGDPAAAGGGGGEMSGPEAAQQGGMPVTKYIESMGQNAMITPSDIESAAEMLSQELLGLPEGIKDSQLRELKLANPVLHSMVKEKMQDIREAAKLQGGAAVMQQQGMGGAGGVPPVQ
jgi:hypothetical protein